MKNLSFCEKKMGGGGSGGRVGGRVGGVRLDIISKNNLFFFFFGGGGRVGGGGVRVEVNEELKFL